MPIVTANVEALAEHGVMGEAWALPPYFLDRRSLALMHQAPKCPPYPLRALPLGPLPAALLGQLADATGHAYLLTPSEGQSVAEPTGQGWLASSLIPLARQLWPKATLPTRNPHPTDTEASATCCQLVAGAVPRTSYRGQKGLPLTCRVSPQQLPKGHFVAEPSGPPSRSKTSPTTSSSTCSMLSTG